MKLDLVGGELILTAPTTAAPLIRQIPGARHDSRNHNWRLPPSWASCVMTKGVIGPSLVVGDDLRDWSWRVWNERVSPLLQLRDLKRPPEPWNETIQRLEADLDVHLRDFQRVGAVFMALGRRVLNADDMRTGKSPQTITAMRLLYEQESVFPAVIVCPNSVKRQWVGQFEKWWPGSRVVVAGSGVAATRNAIATVEAGEADILIIHWSALAGVSKLEGFGSHRLEGCVNCDPASERSPARCEREPKELNRLAIKTVVGDEVHHAKNPGAKQTRAFWAVCHQAEIRFGLTGTPIAGAPDDLWSIMHALAPEEWPVKGTWVDRYVDQQVNVWSGFPDSVGLRQDRREELDKFLLPRFIRRPREAVLDELPPTYERRDVELKGRQKKAYDDLRKKLLVELDGGILVVKNPLVRIGRLRQLASAFGTLDETGRVHLSEPSTKLDELEDVLEELGDRQVVIYAESSQLIDLAEARLLRHDGASLGKVTGNVEEEARAISVDRFQRGDLRYLLATVGAGGEGLTLNSADTCVFLQRPWSAVLDAQARDRLMGFGQERGVLIVDLQTVGTVEQRVEDVLEKKAERLEELVRDESTIRRWLDG